jgi:hypothetical protein
MNTTGVLAPTLAASTPSVIVKVYAGATEIPSMVPPKRPTTLLFKPFSAISSTLSSSIWNCESVTKNSALETVVLHDMLDPGVLLQRV